MLCTVKDSLGPPCYEKLDIEGGGHESDVAIGTYPADHAPK